ncbi:MAG: hypothetical protein C0501_06505 [Isosphaera sp.]|nr:hypothetical protein [Isosphaera sp.]
MIHRIRIQNFRSLADVTVELDPLTVLIGRSGTGKSNFVHAIRFLRDYLASRQKDSSTAAWRRLVHVDHPDKPLGFSVLFSVPGLDDPFEYLLRVRPGEIIEESLRAGDVLLYHQSAGSWVHPPPGSGPHPNGLTLGAIPGLQESTFAYNALRSGIGCYDFPGDALTGTGQQGDPPGHEFADRGDNYLVVADRIFSDPSRRQSWGRVERSTRSVNRAVSGLTLSVPVSVRLDVGHRVNGRTLTLDVRQESEGFRRYLAHMLALYQNPSKQTLLFEHPEVGLHPGALASLAEELKDCPEDGRGQVILTTHSPQLLDYFPVESIRVVDIEHGVSTIGRLDHDQVEVIKDHLMRPGQLLTVDEARLAAPAGAG